MAFKHVAVALIIGIMFSLVVGFGIDAFYPTPEYEDFCDFDREFPRKIAPEVECQDVSQYYDLCNGQDATARFTYDEEGCPVFEECDTCQKEYNEVNERYNRNIFIIAAIIGILAIIFGFYLNIDFMGTGLLFGGMLVLLYGTMRYFGDMSRVMRFIVLLIEFIIIIYLSYTKLTDKVFKKTPKKKKTSSKKRKKRK